MPTHRSLWLQIRDEFAKKGRTTDALDAGEPNLLGPLEGDAMSADFKAAAAAEIEESSRPSCVTASRGATSTMRSRFELSCSSASAGMAGVRIADADRTTGAAGREGCSNGETFR